MFKWFEKKVRIHESEKLQLEDLHSLGPIVKRKILNGANCDIVPNAEGNFGTITNPIPVNGAVGEIKYLGKLRGKTGFPIFFHRVGSVDCKISCNVIDMFEVICMDATQKETLYFDLYHPRRSNIAPENFSLNPLDSKTKNDSVFAFGVTSFVEKFPDDISMYLRQVYTENEEIADAADKMLDKYFKKHPPRKEWIFNQNFFMPNFEQSMANSKKVQSVDEIKNYHLISKTLKNCYNTEKEILTNRKAELFGYTNEKFFDWKNWRSKLIVERFIFFRAYLEWVGNSSFDTSDALKNFYITNIRCNYNITKSETIDFITSVPLKSGRY